MTFAQSHSSPLTHNDVRGIRPSATVIVLATAFCAAAPAQPAAGLRQAQQRIFQAALQTVTPCIVRIDTVGGALPVDQGTAPTPAGFRQADGPTTGLICTADGYIITSSFK